LIKGCDQISAVGAAGHSDEIHSAGSRDYGRDMWIVRLALKQPHTIVVLAILILLFGSFAIARTPIDIFPNIDTGLEPQDMADRIVSITERALTYWEQVEETL
jgi:AcrB/AcrD/AcrF family